MFGKKKTSVEVLKSKGEEEKAYEADNREHKGNV